MKKFLFLLGITLTIMCSALVSAQGWQKLGGDHFIAYFTQDEKFTKEVLDKAEVYYRRIAMDLGYPRYKDFWTWDKRVKIYIYPDHASFLKASGQPVWSHGMADYMKKEIVSYIWAENFRESLLPHEIAHLIFRDFVGFKGEIPLWLDEGVAQWAEEKKRKEMQAMAKQLYVEDKLLLLEDMMKLDIRRLKEVEKVYIRMTRTKNGDDGVLFLSAEVLVGTYYLQAVSLIGFLVERYGSTSFASFCRELRDGKDLEDALRFAYPAHLRSLKELDDKWRKYLAKGI